MNKQQILNITGLTEKEFYNKYPDQESFCNDYPQACQQLAQAEEGIEVTGSLTSPEEIQKLGKAYGFRTDSNKNFQQDMYNYVGKNKPELFKESINKFGPANAGLTNYGSVQGYRPDAYIGPRVADMMGRLGTPAVPQAPKQFQAPKYVEYSNANVRQQYDFDRGMQQKYVGSNVAPTPIPSQPAMPATFPGQQPVASFSQNPSGGWNIGPAQAPGQPGGMPARQQGAAPAQGGKPQMSHMGPWHTNQQGEYTRYYTNTPGDMNPGVQAGAAPSAAPATQAYGGNIYAKGGGVKKTSKKPSVNPYVEVDSKNADAFRQFLPLPMNVSQMLAKVALKDARMSNESLSDDQKLILWNTIQNAMKRSGVTNGGGTEYQDYGEQGYGTPEDFNNWFNRGQVGFLNGAYKSVTNPGFNLASTIGRGRYWQNPQNSDEIYYTDVYDWNPTEKNFKGSNAYQILRNNLRSNEDTQLNKEKNDNYRMNFKLSKKEIDEIKNKQDTWNQGMLGLGSFDNGGEMIKRADGSYSKRGLWDNIRANAGSGKKPTKEMLEQEAKIRAEYAYGGEPQNAGFQALPDYVQEKILSNMAEGGEPNGGMALGQMMAVADKMSKLSKFVTPDKNLDPWIASKLAVMDDSAAAIADYMMYNPEAGNEQEMDEMKNGGYVVRRSHDRKGKTHVVIGPDGTKKYFGDPNMGERGKSKHGKDAFYARHKKNLEKNPYFRAYARATWEEGGEIEDQGGSMFAYGGDIGSATRQDSVDVLNSQLAQNAYYDKLAKYLQRKPLRRKYSKNDENLYKTDFDIDQELENSRNMLKNADIDSKLQYDVLKTTPQELRKKAAQYIKYAKSEGKDKYHYLDLIPPLLNYDAPFALFNSKIKPKGTIERKFDGIYVPGGSVYTWEYDPLAVTPVDMLTPEQKKLREKLYGPQSYSKGNVTNTKSINQTIKNLDQAELDKIDLEKLSSKQLRGLEYFSSENPEMHVINSNAVNAEYTPEHYIDVVDITGKNPQRIPFESLEEKAAYLKENPLLKLDQYTYADSKRRENLKPLKNDTFAYGGIHLDPSKKGTFKAQATRMDMSVQEAASHILANKEDYSPAMVKKANFARNFAKEEGGQIAQYRHGGYIGMDGKFHMAKGSGTFSGNAYYSEGGEEDPNLTAPYDGSNPNVLPPFDPSAYQAMQLPTGYTGYSKKDPATGQFVPIDNVRKDDLWKHLSGSQKWNTGQTATQKVGRAIGDVGNTVNDIASVAGIYSNYKQMNDKNQEMNNYLQSNQSTMGLYGSSAQSAGKGNINVTGTNYGQQWNPQKMGQWSYTGMYNGPQYTTMAEDGLEVSEPILARPGATTPLGESALAFTSFAEPVSMKPNFIKQQYKESLVNSYNPVTYNPSGTDIATKLNNPTNMIYSSWMAKLGAQPSSIKQTDGNGYFAKFPDINTALKAYETQMFGEVDGVFKSNYYKPDTTVDKALKTWSGNGYGGNIYPQIANKTLAELTPSERKELIRRQIKNESSAMYSQLKRKGVLEMGGAYQDGGVVEMTDTEIKQFLEKGGQLEFLD